MSNRFRAADGVTFSRESLTYALDIHKAAKLIRDWHSRPLVPEDDQPPQPRRWQWKITLASGQELLLCTAWELHAFVCGLASAREAMAKKASSGGDYP